MDWSAPVDAYCERISPDFWAEPLNAASNVAFLVAALLAARLDGKPWRGDKWWWALVVLLVAIAVGSFLFHTVATRWARVADVLPITLFIHLYLFLAVWRLLTAPAWAAILATVGFLVASGGFGAIVPAVTLGGSTGYLPALFAMVVVGGLVYRRRPEAGRPLLAAAAIFAASLAARTLDGPVCDLVPIGLHFVWHLLNATVLYLLVWTMLIHGRPYWMR